MNKNKIAILTDSGSDIPTAYLEGHDIFVVPLRVSHNDKEYLDTDLTQEQIHEMLTSGGVKTSLPASGDVLNVLNKIKAQGYEKVFVITISTGLSGTFNFIRIIANDFEGLAFEFLDTKNIGIGSGLSVVHAAKLIARGLDFEDVVANTSKVSLSTKVFFFLTTLEYLKKGGRLGLVDGLLGSILNIKPIISCNEDGIYYTVAKKIGALHATEEIFALIKKYIGNSKNFNLAVAHNGLVEKAAKIKQKLKDLFPNCEQLFNSVVSPALSVHTGPGLLGVGIQILDEA
ncbi:MAG: DegV family protein [Oscillospiraceae bacterium]|nr:DegV family protein [Oscillospiraceae bacterium]